MRPVRFVALSEDGQALVLADEVGRLLALPIDERIATVLHAEPGTPPLAVVPVGADPTPSLSPATSRPASAPASPPRTSPGSPASPSTGCCATPARCSRSGPCSPSTPGAPGSRAPRRPPRWPRWSTAGWPSTASTPRRSPGTRSGATTAPGGSSRPGRRARPPRRPSGISTSSGRTSPRTTTWRSTSAPSVPRRSSARSRHRSGAVTRCPARRAVSRAGAGTACRPPTSRPDRAGTRSGPAGTRCSPRWTVRSAAPRGGVSTRVPRPRWPVPTPPSAGRRRWRRRAARRWAGFRLRRRLGRAEGGPGRTVAGGAPAASHRRGGCRRRRVDGRLGQAA